MKKPHEHKDRAEQIIHYIHQNLDKSLDLKKLASIINLSPFHFQRIFKSIMGESPKQYIKRVRLEHAAHHIALKPEASMLEVAFEFGFTSPEAFSRAFKNYYSLSPLAFRNLDQHEKYALIRNHTEVEHALFLEGPANYTNQSFSDQLETLSLQITKLPIKHFVYSISKLSEFSHLQDKLNEIDRWVKARDLARPTDKNLSLILDFPIYTPLDKCRYYVGHEVRKKPDVQKPVHYLELPSQLYVEFELNGGLTEIVQSVMALVKTWMPENGYQLNHVPILHYPIKNSAGKFSHRIFLAISPA